MIGGNPPKVGNFLGARHRPRGWTREVRTSSGCFSRAQKVHFFSFEGIFCVVCGFCLWLWLWLYSSLWVLAVVVVVHLVSVFLTHPIMLSRADLSSACLLVRYCSWYRQVVPIDYVSHSKQDERITISATILPSLLVTWRLSRRWWLKSTIMLKVCIHGRFTRDDICILKMLCFHLSRRIGQAHTFGHSLAGCEQQDVQEFIM